MTEYWLITITSMNDKGKAHTFTFAEYGSLQDCTRVILTFRPKRGYVKQKFEIERGVTLV